MNKIIVMGRITRDVDVTYTQSQKVVAKFTLAVDRPFPGPDGKKEADFIPVVVWGKGAEMIGNSCQKGHRLLVEGRLQIRQYDGKDGTKKWATEIIANTFEFIERKGYNAEEGGVNTQAQADAFNRELAEAERQAKACQNNYQANSMAQLGEDVPF